MQRPSRRRSHGGSGGRPSPRSWPSCTSRLSPSASSRRSCRACGRPCSRRSGSRPRPKPPERRRQRRRQREQTPTDGRWTCLIRMHRRGPIAASPSAMTRAERSRTLPRRCDARSRACWSAPARSRRRRPALACTAATRSSARHLRPAHGRPPLIIGDSTMIFAAPVLGGLGFEADAHGCRQFSAVSRSSPRADTPARCRESRSWRSAPTARSRRPESAPRSAPSAGAGSWARHTAQPGLEPEPDASRRRRAPQPGAADGLGAL